MQYTILGPSYQGRVIFANINISNPNPKAQEIGLGQLNSLISAIGLASVSDTDQLLNKQVDIKVKIQAAKDGYEASNDVNNWHKFSGGISGTTQAPAAPKKAPWEK